MAEFLGVGDLHMTDAAGRGALSKYIDDPDDMVLDEFGKVVEYGRNKGVNRIFQYGDVAGDMYRLSYPAMTKLSRFLSANDDFMFEFILGNHDMLGEDPSAGHSLEILKLLYNKPNVRFYTRPKTVEIDEVKVRFLPFPHESFDKEALNVFHKEVRGSKNDHGKPFDGESYSCSRAVAVAGHLHTAHRIRNTDYCGTLYQTNFGESLPKYFHHIEFNSAQDFEIKRVKNDPKYKLHNIVLQSRDDLSLIPDSKTDLVKLIIQDGCDVNPSDYAKFTNIVENKNFKTKQDLAAVLTEDLSEGQAIKFNVDEFFSAWIESYDVDEKMRARIKSVRQRVRNSVVSK
jgi:hypothetical protein